MSQSTEHAVTPVRALGSPDPSGYRLLRDTGSTYKDGGEQRVLQIIEAATDLSSTSEELIRHADSWAQRYHLDSSRANIVRCLQPQPNARVLEIGAGCGAITRYLGETCAAVDALEPVPVRAAAAAARNRDLPGVQVFVGELDDVPDTACYDVVVVVGVLEYVGAGSADTRPYLEFLAKIHSRLRDGGTLILAIENKLGVKYLAGAPEDHTNRIFDGLESYPYGGKARTFARAELEAMLRASELLPHTRIAFPDYKLTRAVLGEFPNSARSLLHRIPRFPSPDWRAKRPRLADEASLWRSLVDAGLEADFGNSFLVLAGKGAPSTLWPQQQCGVFYSGSRRAHLVMGTVVTSDDSGTVRLRRRHLAADRDESRQRVHTVESDAVYEDGTDLTALLAEVGVAGIAPQLEQWLSLVDAAIAAGEPGVLDLVPHNLVVSADGVVHPIDIELIDTAGVSRERVLHRGVFWLAYRAAALAAPARWQPALTVGELMIELGVLVGLPADGSWLEDALREEAVLQSLVRPGPPGGISVDEWRGTLQSELGRIPGRGLRRQALGVRLPARLDELNADLKTARAAAKTAKAEAVRLRKQLAAAKAQGKAAPAPKAAPKAAPPSPVRRQLGRLLPRGTRRRELAGRMLRRRR